MRASRSQQERAGSVAIFDFRFSIYCEGECALRVLSRRGHEASRGYGWLRGKWRLGPESVGQLEIETCCAVGAGEIGGVGVRDVVDTIGQAEGEPLDEVVGVSDHELIVLLPVEAFRGGLCVGQGELLLLGVEPVAQAEVVAQAALRVSAGPARQAAC